MHTCTHAHTQELYNKRCLTTHMYVYMYIQAHTPDTRELQTVLFTKAQALFRPFWAIVSAVYPKEHTHAHTRTDTHSRTDAHTRTLRQEFHLHNLIGYGHTHAGGCKRPYRLCWAHPKCPRKCCRYVHWPPNKPVTKEGDESPGDDQPSKKPPKDPES